MTPKTLRSLWFVLVLLSTLVFATGCASSSGVVTSGSGGFSPLSTPTASAALYIAAATATPVPTETPTQPFSPLLPNSMPSSDRSVVFTFFRDSLNPGIGVVMGWDTYLVQTAFRMTFDTNEWAVGKWFLLHKTLPGCALGTSRPMGLGDTVRLGDVTVQIGEYSWDYIRTPTADYISTWIDTDPNQWENEDYRVYMFQRNFDGEAGSLPDAECRMAVERLLSTFTLVN